MTIYLVKWKERDTNFPRQFATSRFKEAEKKVVELIKTHNADIESSDEDAPIHVVRPANQADVINLINSL